jgi:hypothetical protein
MRSNFTSILALGVGLSLTNLVHSQIFTLDCASLIVERGDPILHPGVVTNDSHVHTVVGGTGFNLTEPNELAVGSDNTTCSRQLDHSNYWQPGLYYQENETSYHAIEFEGSVSEKSIMRLWIETDEIGYLLFQSRLRLCSR